MEYSLTHVYLKVFSVLFVLSILVFQTNMPANKRTAARIKLGSTLFIFVCICFTRPAYLHLSFRIWKNRFSHLMSYI